MIALSVQGQRRHLSVLFCDLVDSTPLAERLDPEELAEVFTIWQDACAEAIREHGGHISDYRGDSVLVFFGYPTAFEDDTHRAIRTALGILDRLNKVNARLRETYDVALAVRIGVHAGLVLLSDLGGRFIRDQFALGETLNIAARLQALAAPNQILVSGAIRSLVRGYFVFQELGQYTLKGVSRAVSACRVIGETAAQDRIEAASEKGLTPFVGRESEVAELHRRWKLSAAGKGQATILVGEPGIGKSRLIEAVSAVAAADSGRRLSFRCSAYHSASPLHPVIEQIRAMLQIERGESDPAAVERVRRSLEENGSRDPAGDAELIAALLELPVPETPAMTALTPHQRRARTLDVMVDWIIRYAVRSPLLVVVEDIHWADASTIEFLGRLIRAIGETRVALLLTNRPENRLQFPDQPNLSRLMIGRLSDFDSERLIDHVSRGTSLPAKLRREIVVRADGVPLFVEELVATIGESATDAVDGHTRAADQPLATLSIPLTLEGLLEARLDRQAEARQTAQLGAALGREFSLAIISAVSSLEPAVLLGNLNSLVESDLIQREGAAPHTVYRFKHALIRDAAYQSMLKGQRQRFHQAIAIALEKGIAGVAAPPPEILAHHFTEAGLIERAIPYWREAGQVALRRSANIEAVHHLDRGVELLRSREPGSARDREELSLQLARGAALLMFKGQSAPDVRACFARAHELSRGLEDSPEHFTALFGLARSHITRGSMRSAREIGEQLIAMADRIQDPALELAATTMFSLVVYHMGELPEAMALARKGIAMFDALPPSARQSPLFTLGQHPTVACSFCASFIALLWAEPEEAYERRRQAVANARSTGITFQIANAESWSTMLAILGRDAADAFARTNEVMMLASEYVFPHLECVGKFHLGVLLVEQGRLEEGLTMARDGMAAVDNLGSHIFRVRLRALFAQACGLAGHWEEGLTWLAEAYSAHGEYGEQWWEPELHRIEGDLRREGGDPVAAERCYREALTIAQARGLRLFELRSATSLAQRLCTDHRPDEARETLRSTLAKFAGEVDLPDFRDARAVFDSLAN